MVMKQFGIWMLYTWINCRKKKNSEKRFTYETNTRKYWKMVFGKFFKNTTKHRKIFFWNYFPFQENIFRKLFSWNYFTVKRTHIWFKTIDLTDFAQIWIGIFSLWIETPLTVILISFDRWPPKQWYFWTLVD